MPERLSLARLPLLADTVARPGYDPTLTRPGVVHLGIGAFHRGHQAVYLDDCLCRGEADWAIVGASLRSPAMRDALAPQDHLYTLLVRSDGDETARVIGSIRDILVAPENPAALLGRLADPRTRIVSLTVTEKGYCHDPATGELNEAAPEIRHDIAAPQAPVSAPGFLVEALARRRAAGTTPFTVLSCDNLPSNGVVTRRVVVGLARLRDPDLARWMEEAVAFPSTMVDRIVPATSDTDIAEVANRTGLEDHWPVATERFSQWVVEDRFPAGRPALEAVGVQMVADVAPFEAMKLRLLNGSHSALAYVGYLAGCETVAEVMADPLLRQVPEGVMEEAAATLTVPPGADVAAYRQALLERFGNRTLRHRTWQIAMDGSQKLPQRLLGSIVDRRAAGMSAPWLTLGVAAWIRYAAGIDERGRTIDVRDPLAESFRRTAAVAGPDSRRLAAGFLALKEVFGQALPADQGFVEELTATLDRLVRDGARATVARMARIRG